jgi:eukaryotic-like serine/threonine-protein kinase
VPLEPGTRLGAHEIVGLLGAGGMGEVYRANDTRLKREVAIKVLPEAFAQDPDRAARFQREAELLASLNHPNIAAIYGLERIVSSTAGQATVGIVLELVEGHTVADLIVRGPMPPADALPLARQIAEALEAAHDKGVVHRDLKPANIKITPDGRVKVLDFGLAKMLESNPASSSMSMSPTLSVHATYAGTILGTAAYMSPEQARGKPVDRRTDVWAFGCVLYEMLTGKHSFEPGETVSDAIVSVLSREPDWTALPADTPAPIRRLLRRCLQKDPQKRLPHIGAARIEIDEALSGVDEPSTSTPTVHAERLAEAPRRLWLRAIVAAAVLVTAAAVTGFIAWRVKPEPARTVTRFSIVPPADQRMLTGARRAIALSPDGTSLAYSANQRLYVRSLSSLESRAVPGSDLGVSAAGPAFSPDGQSLVFGSPLDHTVKRVAVTGGAVFTMYPNDAVYGMTWDETGIIFGQPGKGIVRVPPTGGTPETIVPVANDELASSPQLLNGGSVVLFSLKKATDTWDRGQVVAQSLRSGERKILVNGGADGHYLSSGHLVYATSGVLLAVPFDVRNLAVGAGGPVQVLEGVQRTGMGVNGTGQAQYTYGSNGTLAYLPGPVTVSASAGLDLAIFDRSGGSQPLKLPPGAYRAPRVSPDGNFVAFERAEDTGEVAVWIHEIAGRTAMRRLTFGGRSRAPVWSPDGQWIAFQSDRDGDNGVFRQRADGTGVAERLTDRQEGSSFTPQSWSRDGAELLVTVEKDNRFTLATLSVKERRVTSFGDVQSVEPTEAAFSPDGQWIVYQIRASSSIPRQIFVQPFPATGAKYLVPQASSTVSTGPGHPFWNRKGTEIIVNAAPTDSYAVAFTAKPQVQFGRPADFPRQGRAEPNPSTNRRWADAMPDGDHIIGITAPGSAPGAQNAAQINVVLNWFDEVRRRVPLQ